MKIDLFRLAEVAKELNNAEGETKVATTILENMVGKLLFDDNFDYDEACPLDDQEINVELIITELQKLKILTDIEEENE